MISTPHIIEKKERKITWKIYKGGPGITTKQKNALIKSFSMDDPAIKAAEHADVNRNTADLWYRHFRELIFQATRRAPRLFGEVEMDQAAFGGRGRKKMMSALKRLAKKLPHHEYMEKAKEVRSEHKTQVFGILQRGGNVYTHIIKDQSARTLTPIVRMVVEDTAIVYTDKWGGFKDLKLDGYTHRSVNHSREYVAKDGSYINSIESFWSFAKDRLGAFRGISMTVLPLHIKECEWRWNIGAEDRNVSAKARWARVEKALRALM